MNRVRFVKLAVELACGALITSDTFFPFPDGPEAAAGETTAVINRAAARRWLNDVNPQQL